MRLLLLFVAAVAVAGAFMIGHTTAHRTQVVNQSVKPALSSGLSSCSPRVGVPC
jgi:hypothetical protein